MAKPTPQLNPSIEPDTDINAFAPGSSSTQPIKSDDFDRNIWCLLGLPIDVTTIDGAMAQIDNAVRQKKRLSFVTPNVNWLVRALRDPKARQEILAADLSLVDGAPLAALAKSLSIPLGSRIAGSDLFAALARRPAFGGAKTSVFFFGGRDGAAEKAMENLNRQNGGLICVGSLNPGHGDIDSMSDQSIIDQINAANPDFIVVALGAEKGQAWIDRNKDRLSAPVMAHLGAVIDFTAGTIVRAPKFFRDLGLEWLWRIKEEPSLWRRYLSDAVGMARVCIRNLLPQIGFAGQAPLAESARADSEHSQAGSTVILSGDVTWQNLRPVRDAFRQAAARKVDICLDFTGITSSDRAFLGLVLMLEKNLMGSDAQISVHGASKKLARALKANQMNYRLSAISLQQSPDNVNVERRAI